MNNRTLIIGFSNFGNTYLMNLILLKKQEPSFILTKSLNQYPNLNAQTTDRNEPLENYEKSTVVSVICYYQNKKAILICFLQEGDTVKLIFTRYLKGFFTCQKIQFVKLLL